MSSATGITVFAGMLGVTAFGLLLTPVLYVALRTFVTRFGAAATPAGAVATARLEPLASRERSNGGGERAWQARRE